MKNTIFTSIFYLIIIIFFSSCTTTREIYSTRELENYKETGDVTIITKDSIKYVLTFYSLKDSVLAGKGTMEIKDSLRTFDGKINYRDIRHVECRKTDFLKTVVGIVPAAIVTYVLLNCLTGDDGVGNTVVIKDVTGIVCK